MNDENLMKSKVLISDVCKYYKSFELIFCRFCSQQITLSVNTVCLCLHVHQCMCVCVFVCIWPALSCFTLVTVSLQSIFLTQQLETPGADSRGSILSFL